MVAGFSFLVWSGFRFEENQYAYPLDDTFIHLSMAKNLAFEGVWGIISHEFSSTSSSPLFTLLLSGLIKVFGNIHTLPLVINGILLVFFVYYLFVKSYLSDKGHWGGIAGTLAVLVSLPHNLAAMGMEHMLQITFVLLLVDRIFKKNLYIESSPLQDWYLLVLTLLNVGIRFESIFLIAPLCFFFLFQKRWKDIIGLTAVAFLPVVIYGIFSISNGSGFFPNSLLMKGHSGDGIIHTLYLHFGSFYKNLFVNGSLVVYLLLPLVIQFFVFWKQRDERYKSMLALYAIVVMILHHFFAQVGWLYRYENYTMMCGALVLWPLLEWTYRKFRSELEFRQTIYPRLVTVLGIGLLVSPFFVQFAKATHLHYAAQGDIYYQHIINARFAEKELKALLGESTIAINDIGAISYYADLPIVDIWGLGTYEVTQHKHDEPSDYIPELFAEREVRYALYYPFFQSFFEGWYIAGEWDMGERHVAANRKVIFAAKSQEEAEELREILKGYESKLPERISVIYP